MGSEPSLLYLKAPGHDRLFYDVLTHLCLGLGLSTPPLAVEALLRHWPPYQPLTSAGFSSFA